MTSRLAFEAIELKHGGDTVQLWPCLRAGLLLVRKFSMGELRRDLEQMNLSTLRYIIALGCNDQRRADDFMARVSKDGLCHFQRFTNAIRDYLEISLGLDDTPDHASEAKAATSGKLKKHSEHLIDLYEFATGWLAWTPQQAWSATPAEILVARNGRFDMLQKTNPFGTEKDADRKTDPEQAARNVAEGLDPTYDREGARAMFARMGAA